MDLVTVIMLLVGLLLIIVYFVSIAKTDGVKFKKKDGDVADGSQARSAYDNSMALILALGATMLTLATVMMYKPDAISIPKGKMLHGMMAAAALAVMILTSVAISKVETGKLDTGIDGEKRSTPGKDLTTFLGVALLPASVAAVILGVWKIWEPQLLTFGGSSNKSEFGFDFEF